MLATGFLLGFIVLLLLLLLYTSRASRKKNREKAAGSQPFQANSCGSMATASPESVSVEEEESHVSGAEGEGWTVAGGGKFSHPVYKKLSSLSGELNGLPLSKVKEKLTSLNLSSM